MPHGLKTHDASERRSSVISQPDVPVNISQEDALSASLNDTHLDSLVIHDSPSSVRFDLSSLKTPEKRETRAVMSAFSSPSDPSMNESSSSMLQLVLGPADTPAFVSHHHVTIRQVDAATEVAVPKQDKLAVLRDVVRNGKDDYGQLTADSIARMKQVGLSPIQPIHGPTSLPYARCPSGSDCIVTNANTKGTKGQQLASHHNPPAQTHGSTPSLFPPSLLAPPVAGPPLFTMPTLSNTAASIGNSAPHFPAPATHPVYADPAIIYARPAPTLPVPQASHGAYATFPPPSYLPPQYYATGPSSTATAATAEPHLGPMLRPIVPSTHGARPNMHDWQAPDVQNNKAVVEQGGKHGHGHGRRRKGGGGGEKRNKDRS